MRELVVAELRIGLDEAQRQRALADALGIEEAARQAHAAHVQAFELLRLELFADDPHADSRNFVLCPGKAYDRSPCGTGTSAKLACLAAAGKLAPGQVWRQASVIGSVFEGWYEPGGDAIVPTIRGQAFISAEATLLIQPDDPFGWGLG